jgi:BirA family biotin operon repressor/biotin-[acetyl-CoA-carboxylase] ligase
MNTKLLKAYLNNNVKAIMHFKSIDSTNIYARQNIDNIEHNTLIIADEQTNGIGRHQREFVSNKDKGLYVSLVLKKDDQKLHIDQLTMIIAVAIVQTIKDLYDIQLQIKWVNDLYLKNKKVCGILCNTIMSIDNEFDSAIIGFGLNLNNSALPDVATSLFREDRVINKEQLLAIIINNFFNLYLENANIIDYYKKHMFLLNQKVELRYQNQDISALVVDVDEKGGLLLELDNKDVITIYSGEVSISKESLKKIFNYDN